MASAVPPRDVLFKYRSFDPGGNTLRMIADGEVFMAPPASFNDPFDFVIPHLYMSGAGGEDVVKYFRDGQIRQGYDPDSPEMIEAEARFRAKLPRNHAEAVRMDIERAVQIASEAGVLSLTPDETHPLMWAHYAANHTGIAVGFNIELLYESLKRATQSRQFYGTNVTYTKSYPKINPHASDFDQAAWGATFDTKQAEWTYESEYRLIWADVPTMKEGFPNPRILHVPQESITTVVLGMRILTSDQLKVIEALRSTGSKAKLFRAEPKDFSYEMVLVPLQY